MSSPARPDRVAVVGAGRLGTALAGALTAAGCQVEGPLGRGATGQGADLVLLCVPDREIEAAAAALAPRAGLLVGHCSGATSLQVLGDHEALGLHPLMTIPASGADFRGVTAAVAGTSDRALAMARSLAAALGMVPVEIGDEDRGAYHAAASVASNFLLTVEDLAERLAATAGLSREHLVPIVRATVENWARDGAAAALTGPVARGDEVTVARQREAVTGRSAADGALFEALVAATRRLAAGIPGGGTARGSAAEQRRPASPVRTVRTVRELRAAVAAGRREGRTVALVPTMGALHDGHLSLIRAARAAHGLVVVSVFVNPAQFTDAGDLAAYPRDEERDTALAAGAGADLVFAPGPAEVYPGGFATTVRVHGVSEPLEGAHRGAAHFDGVATVVCKLLSMTGPDVAYFGQKDAQQVAVVQRMVRDLDLPVRIEVEPTVREPDGLALSSRNVRLSAQERARAVALKRGLDALAAALAEGAGVAEAEAAGRAAMEPFGVRPEYLALVDPATFGPVQDPRGPGEALAVVAARVGPVRLIDNLPIHLPDAAPTPEET